MFALLIRGPGLPLPAPKRTKTREPNKEKISPNRDRRSSTRGQPGAKPLRPECQPPNCAERPPKACPAWLRWVGGCLYEDGGNQSVSSPT